MYPANYFGLFPAFPRDERGFVAMSFAPQFDARWNSVIAPAIRAIGIGDVRLEPHRVDLGTAGDSILTEILDNIARCRIFVADITSMGEIDGRPMRNANVLYEVGLAHAVRQPEEVILLRSDDLPLGFDIANVRVHRYDPDGTPEEAKRFVAERIFQAIGEVDAKKNLAVRRAVQSLDYESWWTLSQANIHNSIRHPASRTMGQILGASRRAAAISRLLELGAIHLEFIRPTEELLSIDDAPGEEMVCYKPTAFGIAIFQAACDRQGFFDPETQKLIERLSKVYGQKLAAAKAKDAS